MEYAKEKGITLLHLDVGQNIEPFLTMDMDKTRQAVVAACGEL